MKGEFVTIFWKSLTNFSSFVLKLVNNTPKKYDVESGIAEIHQRRSPPKNNDTELVVAEEIHQRRTPPKKSDYEIGSVQIHHVKSPPKKGDYLTGIAEVNRRNSLNNLVGKVVGIFVVAALLSIVLLSGTQPVPLTPAVGSIDIKYPQQEHKIKSTRLSEAAATYVLQPGNIS